MGPFFAALLKGFSLFWVVLCLLGCFLYVSVVCSVGFFYLLDLVGGCSRVFLHFGVVFYLFSYLSGTVVFPFLPRSRVSAPEWWFSLIGFSFPLYQVCLKTPQNTRFSKRNIPKPDRTNNI